MNLLGGTGSGGARFTHGPTRCLLARAPRGRAALPRPCRHLRCTQGPAAGLGGVLCRSPSEPTQGTGRAQVSPRPQKHREGLPLRIELASVPSGKAPALPVLCWRCLGGGREEAPSLGVGGRSSGGLGAAVRAGPPPGHGCLPSRGNASAGPEGTLLVSHGCCDPAVIRTPFFEKSK